MAGDWIPIRQALHDDPAVYALRDALSKREPVSRNAVIGALVRFWSWVSDHSADGCLGSMREAAIDSIVEQPGFCAAMLDPSVGWITRQEGRLHVVKFDRWLSNGGKARLGAAAKQRDYRSRRPPPSRDGPTAGSPGPSPEAPPARERAAKKQQAPIPPALLTPEFEAAWAEWLDERRQQRRKPYTATGATKQLSLLAEMGPARAVAAIQHSIAQGWTGIFEPNTGGRGPGMTPLQAAAQRRAEKRAGEYAEEIQIPILNVPVPGAKP